MSDYTTIRAVAESVAPPWVLWTDEPARTIQTVFWPYDERNAQLSVRWLNGRRMATGLDAMDEMASALQFPWYFGRNWDAVDECLQDTNWEKKRSYIVFIRHAEDVLSAEPGDGLSHLIQVFGRAGESVAVERQLSFDQLLPPTPLHVAFVVEPAMRERWLGTLAAQGIDISTLPLRDLRSWPDRTPDV